jgi:hypothetical protein
MPCKCRAKGLRNAVSAASAAGGRYIFNLPSNTDKRADIEKGNWGRGTRGTKGTSERKSLHSHGTAASPPLPPAFPITCIRSLYRQIAMRLSASALLSKSVTLTDLADRHPARSHTYGASRSSSLNERP